jgi:hypothetical protein
VTSAFDDFDATFTFPCGERPFLVNDRFRVCGDIRMGDLVRFERVDDHFVLIIAITDGRDWRAGDTFRCEPGPGPNDIAFVPVPPLAS